MPLLLHRIGLAVAALTLAGTALRAAEPAPVAKVAGTVLTEDQLRAEMGSALYDAERGLYQVKKNWVDQKAKQIVFDAAAKEAGLSRADWQNREINQKVTPPTPQEIESMAQRMAQPRGGGPAPTGEALKPFEAQASGYLMQQKMAQREQEVFQALKAKYPVEMLVAKPMAHRENVAVRPEDSVKGPKEAKVTIVEFTDFQCPWCARAQDVLHSLEQKYGKNVRFVSRQFPLTNMHPRAFPAAEAAFCAQDQGKFWPYRDVLFKNQQKLEDADLKRYAQEQKLNMKKFEACVAGRRHQSRVEGDLQEGQRVGVRGTPTFFVNGIRASFNELEELVQSELGQ